MRKTPKIVAAKSNGEYLSFTSIREIPSHAQKIDMSSLEGIRIYRDSLVFVLIKAAKDLFPLNKLRVHYSINKGAFCEFDQKVTQQQLDDLGKRMKEIIASDIPIEKHVLDKKRAISILMDNQREETAEILKVIHKKEVTLFSLEGMYGYFTTQLTPSTGFVDIFDMSLYDPGFILFFPTRFHTNHVPAFTEQKKLFQVFKEFSEWGKILEADSVSSINRHVRNKSIKELIMVNEALHEKKVSYIADKIKKRKKKFVLIAGPSSSGKTSFAKRLAIQLKANRIHSIIISLDHYYKNSEHIPLDENGEKDLETLEALDICMFNKNLKEILDCGVTNIPLYDFLTQSRRQETQLIETTKEEVIIIEGIHGLNPKLISSIEQKYVYKVYISALTSLNLDDHNRFATTDTRLIRRITRDYSYRGATAEQTILMWPSVRKGEDLYIFPYQEQADMVFNSALTYEHGVLKKMIQPMLKKIPLESPAYSEAKRISDILSFFEDIDDRYISNTSLLREFIGGSQLL